MSPSVGLSNVWSISETAPDAPWGTLILRGNDLTDEGKLTQAILLRYNRGRQNDRRCGQLPPFRARSRLRGDVPLISYKPVSGARSLVSRSSAALLVNAAAIITSQRSVLRSGVVDLSLSRLDPRLGTA